jgi:uncharacterized protein (TIGR02996 family)
MNPPTDLLDAIVADPADITPRLILADWLADHDQAKRASLIHVPFGLLPPMLRPEGTETAVRLYRRRHDLVVSLFSGLGIPPSYSLGVLEEDDLFPDLTLVEAGPHGGRRRRVVGLLVRHGFVEGIACPELLLLRIGAELFHRHPIREVVLNGAFPLTGGDRSPLRGWLCGPAGRDAPWWVRCSSVAPVLFDRLRGREMRTATGERQARMYEEASERPRAALTALSQACVSWGREVAGLPPLSS